ncbi:hypothetical protein EVAR_57389_1 [Eumeta japonica]|uniref:Uncharacterized protein n=1 Tax=Eumeta variegata TaxID=151549 RepID=A0A4C1ZI19_EUMVA|nr:hypothetical protein EVAR_57389_1 [Eumeta japonica]
MIVCCRPKILIIHYLFIRKTLNTKRNGRISKALSHMDFFLQSQRTKPAHSMSDRPVLICQRRTSEMQSTATSVTRRIMTPGYCDIRKYRCILGRSHQRGGLF